MLIYKFLLEILIQNWKSTSTKVFIMGYKINYKYIAIQKDISCIYYIFSSEKLMHKDHIYV
jgi:hypothetical protein